MLYASILAVTTVVQTWFLEEKKKKKKKEMEILSLTIRFAPVQAIPRSRVLLPLGLLPVLPRGRFLLVPGRGRSVLLLLVTRLVHGRRVATLVRRPRLRIVILGGHVVA